MSKNAARYTGFAEYMRERLPELRRLGMAKGIPDCVEICRPDWKKMSHIQQQLYTNRAKELKIQEKCEDLGPYQKNKKDHVRLNNLGAVIVQKRSNTSSAYTLESRVTSDMSPQEMEQMGNVKFHIVSFQYACVIVQPDIGKEYLPVEMAVVEWSLGGGISGRYHKFISPGIIPVGYGSACRDRSENVHGIPHENFELASQNYEQLWRDLANMTNNNNSGFQQPVIYCIQSEKEVVQYCIHWLHIQSGSPFPNTIRVLSLENCVQELVERTGKHITIQSICNDLEVSTYDYEPGTRCKFHEEHDNINCALASVHRCAFAMGTILSKDIYYNFKLDSKYIPTIKSYKPVNPKDLLKGDTPVATSSSKSVDRVFPSRDFRFQEAAAAHTVQAESSVPQRQYAAASGDDVANLTYLMAGVKVNAFPLGHEGIPPAGLGRGRAQNNFTQVKMPGATQVPPQNNPYLPYSSVVPSIANPWKATFTPSAAIAAAVEEDEDITQEREEFRESFQKPVFMGIGRGAMLH